ncbi:heme-binding protein [Tabrizicola sp. J26]|uniref:GlcG/HbpS family heme-binding protein n=1 Tax=Alitabrizicola rongguiensis TaxID=2909234 RepID=UPI001F1C9AF9|nr:heme-binding protein [Tabrizicola rongguiensis]MCF1709429.1 heme-binding protein [Tabrizicola rongguiensis]
MTGTAATTTRRDITTETAAALVRAAIDEATRIKVRICAVAVDASGLPLALLRMNGVNEPMVAFATDKAWTAATMRRGTDALRQRMEQDPLRLGAANRERLMLWGGGLPIVIDGEVVGAIGVSGALVDQDVHCAEAALASCGLSSTA